MGQRAGYTHLDTKVKERLFTNRKALFAHWRECDEAREMLSAAALKRLCYGEARSARISVLNYIEALIADWSTPGSVCSKFKIAVHPDVMDTLNALSPALRANVYFILRTIMEGGLTALNQTNITFGGRPSNGFALKVPTHLGDINVIDGFLIQGFFPKDFDQTFYLQSIEELTSNKKIFSLPRYVDPPEGLDVYNTAAYLPITFGDAQKATAHPIGSLIRTRLHTPWCPALVIERYFYPHLPALEAAVKCRQNLGSSPMLETKIGDYVDYIEVFERGTSLDFEALQDAPADTIRLVSFIDKTDAFSMAQQDFVRIMAINLKQTYQNNSFEIIEIIIKDEGGKTPHFDLFLQEHRRNLLLNSQPGNSFGGLPKSFSILIGAPHTDENRQAQILMCFDLFQGCVYGHQLPYEFSPHRTVRQHHLSERNSGIFRSNIKYLTHTLMALTGYCAPKAFSRSYDMRGREDIDLASAYVMLGKHAVVVSVADERGSRAEKLALKAASHMALRGYPHVMTLLVDRYDDDSDMVEVHIADELNYYGHSVEDLESLDDEDFALGICLDIEKAYKATQALSCLLPTNHPDLTACDYMQPGLFNDPQRQMGFLEEDRPKN
ncbi:hypothetical protein [Roseibium algae]|uniref:Uncharacterized protein n=1 Tax=Roseibium algae TaxID=3123038 RepID=A0ABU8TGT9_9HYPH